MADGNTARPAGCVVIGAGVIGVCVAARLAEAGARVTLLEQGEPGRGATWSSFAWLNANEKLPRGYHDLNHAGMRAWAALADGLGGAAWHRPVGNIEWAADAGGHEELAGRVRRLAGWGYPAQLTDAAQAVRLEPGLRLPRSVSAVAWFPGEGYLLTERLVADLIERAARNGTTVLTGEPGRVTGFEARDGAVVAVRTAAGQVIPADVVVCCAGRWVPGLAKLGGAGGLGDAAGLGGAAGLGDAAGLVPLVDWAGPGATAPELVVRAGPVTTPGPTRVVHAPTVNVRPHHGGQVHIESPGTDRDPSAPEADLHTPQTELRRQAGELLRRARGVTTGLEQAEVTGYRMCVRPMPADGKPIVGWLADAGGLYVAVTHSGVTLAAHLARLVTAEIVTGTATAELAPYRPGRFATGC